MELDNKYPKIQTLYKRDNNGKIIVGEYSMPEFEAVRAWRVEEKIDGTNIRIGYHDRKITIKGRTDKADLTSMGVLPVLEAVAAGIVETLTRLGLQDESLTFYGEAFGGKIQKAGQLYSRDEIRFSPFDVLQYRVGWWDDKTLDQFLREYLDRRNYRNYFIWVPPPIGIGHKSYRSFDLSEIPDLVRSRPESKISYTDGQPIEGIIARPYDAMVYNRRGERVMFKLKVKDFNDVG